METGIKAIYRPYASSMERGYTFDIILEQDIKINGINFETSVERDDAAKRVCKELGLIMAVE